MHNFFPEAPDEKFNKKVLLMDLDLQFGDIALMVNKQSELTLKELYDDNSVKSYEDVSPYLYKFKQGYDMLFAPKDPESAEYINKDQIIETISLLKKHYDYIVIDTPSVLGAADVNLIEEHGDGLLMAVRAGKTRARSIRAA